MDEENVKELEVVLKRIEAYDGTKQGKMLVKGTIIAEGDEIIRTTLPNTTSLALVKNMDLLKDICSKVVREQQPHEKLHFVRVDYKDQALKNAGYQIMMGVEDNFKAIVVQEYEIRDLRERSANEQKDIKGYKHIQKDYFFPSLEK